MFVLSAINSKTAKIKAIPQMTNIPIPVPLPSILCALHFQLYCESYFLFLSSFRGVSPFLFDFPQSFVDCSQYSSTFPSPLSTVHSTRRLSPVLCRLFSVLVDFSQSFVDCSQYSLTFPSPSRLFLVLVDFSQSFVDCSQYSLTFSSPLSTVHS